MGMPSRLMYDMPRSIRSKLVKQEARFVLAGYDRTTAKEMARSAVRQLYTERGKDFVRDYPQWRDLFVKTAAKQLGRIDL